MIAAGFAFGIWLASWPGSWRRSLREPPDGIRSIPQEPCWTEAIARDGWRSFERSECVDDVLMRMDARAARGDFPVPRQC
jgi:hypothetical protein